MVAASERTQATSDPISSRTSLKPVWKPITMVDTEKICLKLNGLETIIAAMIDLKKDVSERVEQYDKLIDTLPSEANEAAASYREKWASYMIRWSLYQPTSKGQEKDPKKEDKPPVLVDVPREPAITHDGRVETFYAFWLMMEKRILKRTELDEGAKFGRLYGALSDVDKVNTGGMSLKEAESYLFKRYRSPDAIRRYLQDTFSPDRKSTRLNSSHVSISYSVFCLKKNIKYIFHVI